MELVFASGNKNKIKEIQAILPAQVSIKTLTDIGIDYDIPEPHDNLSDNAIEKARHVFEKTGFNVFGEDTGLEVGTLNGAPGVYSARYAGPEKDANSNMNLLLKNLDGQTNRSAHFRSVIALYLNGELNCFEGILTGRIAFNKRGNYGFGYDPIFIPEGYNKTLAEIDEEKKNELSHRARAFNKLLAFIESKL